MKKLAITAGSIILLIIILAIISTVRFKKRINWELSFNEKSATPYGVQVFYKELPSLFPNKKIRTIYHTPSSYLIANSEDGYGNHTAKGNFIVIGNSDYMYDASIDELLKFVSNGNQFFISDYVLPQALLDTLNVSVNYKKHTLDSLSHLQVISKENKKSSIVLDKIEGAYFFEKLNKIQNETTVLGYTFKTKKHPNFIRIKYGKGSIYMHLEPKVFTNYHLLKPNTSTYTQTLMQYLPNRAVYFDSYSKIYTSYHGDIEKKSNLSWFLKQPAFKWAWYTALLLCVIFIVFNAKRRQRIINIIKPTENTSLEFVKTVSNLYFETHDHGNIIEKKILYFLEKVRMDYYIDTKALTPEFTSRLALKSGVPLKKTQRLINYINWLRTKTEFFEENLIKLNKLIEEFYSK